MNDEPDPRRWRILAVTLLIGFMSLLDVTIVNVAIPSMRAGLDTTAGTVQWVVSGYALAFGLTLVAGGRLGDAHGRRRMMLIGLTGFIVSSAAVGLAPNVELVIAARLAQGATAGLLTPQNSGLIQQLFRGAERGRAFGFFGLTVSISSALGPVLGGLILALAGEEDGWRCLFLVNVPIGLVALVAIARMVPGASAQPDRDTRIDLVGAALLGLGVLSRAVPAGEPGGWCPASPGPARAGTRAPGRLREVGTTRRTHRRGSDPRRRSAPTDAWLCERVGDPDALLHGVHRDLPRAVGLPAGRAGLSPLTAGLLITPFALGSAATAMLAGRLVSVVGRRITLISLTVMMTGVLATALLVPGRVAGDLWWVLVPTLLLAGLGGGGVISPNFTLSLAEVPPAMGGAAGGALQTGAADRVGHRRGAVDDGVPARGRATG